ncbi:MAG: PA2779 family protein [Gammaproteobacteria bacterium]|jgi:non-ribosomal peptide synthetase component F|nr:PA2779 family protein [Gammaproteobacteria bacterium]
MLIRQVLRSALILLLSVQLVTLGMPMAEASMIRTDEYAAAEERDERLSRVQDFLAEERVAAQFEALGVDPEQAAERVAALTDAELAQLDSQLSELPAGAGVLTVLGILFVVILVLELVGITNIFVAI